MRFGAIYMKKCSNCKEIKTLEEFHKNNRYKFKRHLYCKQCVAIKWLKNKKDRTEYLIKYEENRIRPKEYNEKKSLKSKEYWKKEKDNLKEPRNKLRLKREYNLTVEQYNQLVEDQQHMCFICEVHEDTLKRKLAVDHCHKTGKIRGLLCFHCNTGLGHFRDNEKLLTKAIKYLTKP